MVIFVVPGHFRITAEDMPSETHFFAKPDYGAHPVLTGQVA
jgi:hypothetical protein